MLWRNRCFDSDQTSAAPAQSENSASKPEGFRLSGVLAFVRRGHTYELGSIRGAGQPRCPELRNRKILQRGLAFVFASTFGEWQRQRILAEHPGEYICGLFAMPYMFFGFLTGAVVGGVIWFGGVIWWRHLHH